MLVCDGLLIDQCDLEPSDAFDSPSESEEDDDAVLQLSSEALVSLLQVSIISSSVCAEGMDGFHGAGTSAEGVASISVAEAIAVGTASSVAISTVASRFTGCVSSTWSAATCIGAVCVGLIRGATCSGDSASPHDAGIAEGAACAEDCIDAHGSSCASDVTFVSGAAFLITAIDEIARAS